MLLVCPFNNSIFCFLGQGHDNFAWVGLAFLILFFLSAKQMDYRQACATPGCLCFETRFHYVAQFGLKFLGSSAFSCLSLNSDWEYRHGSPGLVIIYFLRRSFCFVLFCLFGAEDCTYTRYSSSEPPPLKTLNVDSKSYFQLINQLIN